MDDFKEHLMSQPTEQPTGSAFTHPKANTNLDQAKDGRWVLLIGGNCDSSMSDYAEDENWVSAPMMIARWDAHQDPGTGTWRFASFDGGYFGNWIAPTAFVELHDLGFFKPHEVKSEIEILSLITVHDMEEWLVNHDFFVGERNPRANTDFPGKWMVIDTETKSILDSTALTFPDAGKIDGWCIVGDDRDQIIQETFRETFWNHC